MLVLSFTLAQEIAPVPVWCSIHFSSSYKESSLRSAMGRTRFFQRKEQLKPSNAVEGSNNPLHRAIDSCVTKVMRSPCEK